VELKTDIQDLGRQEGGRLIEKVYPLESTKIVKEKRTHSYRGIVGKKKNRGEMSSQNRMVQSRKKWTKKGN